MLKHPLDLLRRDARQRQRRNHIPREEADLVDFSVARDRATHNLAQEKHFIDVERKGRFVWVLAADLFLLIRVIRTIRVQMFYPLW